MAKVSLTDLVNLQNETTAVNAINTNNATLEVAFENTLSRDGSIPNQMGANLDMNSHQILNLPFPSSGHSPMRLVDAELLNGGGTITTGDAFNVINYGANSTGTADNTAAFASAIAAAYAFNPLGATVYIPQGTYLINSPIVLPRAVNLVGDHGRSSQIIANNTDVIHLSLPAIAYGQQTIKGLYFVGENATAARSVVSFSGDNSSDNIIAGFLFEENVVTNFDTVLALKSIQDAIIQNNYAININNGCIFTGIVYNTIIQNNTFQYISGSGPASSVTNTGVGLFTYNYTTLGGVLPPEGITISNNQLFGFQRCIDADACDTLNIDNNNIVSIVQGIRFLNVTTQCNITRNNIEMHSVTASHGIIGSPLSGSVTTHRTVIANNTVQTNVTTTSCSGIQINSAGNSFQDDVIIENNYCKNMNVYDIALYNPGGNTRAINNKCSSTATTGSMLIGTPVSPSQLLLRGNSCFKTIDYTNSSVDWTAGTIISDNNTINNGTIEKSSWNVTAPSARFISLTGPTAARTYTLPDATDTITTNAAAQTLSNKTLVAPALGTPTSGVATNLTGTAAGLTAGNVITNANLTGPVTSSGNATTIGANQVSRNNLAQGSARSVIGVTGNATANVADIQGTANQFLGVNSAGTALAFQSMSGDATLSGGAITVTKTSGSTFTSAAVAPVGQLPATATNDNAIAGNLGEYIESAVVTGSAVSLVTATAKTVTSISLTAGDWDVDAVVNFNFAAATNTTATTGGISLTTNTLDSTPGRETTMLYNGVAPTTGHISQVVPPYRLSLASTTTVFLIAQAAFTASTQTAYGLIRARRVR